MVITIRKKRNHANVWDIKEKYRQGRQRVGFIRKSIFNGTYQVRIDILQDARDVYRPTLEAAIASAHEQLEHVDRHGVDYE